MKNFKETLIELLKSDERFLIDSELSLNHVKDSIDTLDEGLLDLLYNNEQTREKFFEKNKNSDYIKFKGKDFKFFLDENKLDNSYTQFENQIGLFFYNKLLRNRGEVVLNFPFKDCVLEGGQSSDDGEDVYFEYSEKSSDFEEKKCKRKEIFFNEVLGKDEIDRLKEDKVLVNWKRFTKESVRNENIRSVQNIKRDENGLIKENLIIKGNNLLALHSIKKEFSGKIKLIYIDPPYNTGNDSFKYNDNFNHSTWLTFMKNRLEVAKELLRDDGVIFIQCDDNEQAYLKILMDEVFGRENFVNCIVNQSAKSVFGTKASAKEKTIVKTKDYILMYKNSDFGKLNPLYTKSENPIFTSHDFIYENGIKIDTKEWFLKNYKDTFENYNLKITKDNIIKLMKLDKNFYNDAFYKLLDIQFSSTLSKRDLPIELEEKLKQGEIINYENVLYIRENNGEGEKRFCRSLKESCFQTDDHYSEFCKSDILGDVWDTSQGYGNISNDGKIKFENGKKPEILLQKILKLTTQPGDIVLDYHLGSGTTCAVAHKMGRQYIGIEQMDYIETIAVERLKKVIGKDEKRKLTNEEKEKLENILRKINN